MQAAVGYRQRNDGFGLLPNNDLRDLESHAGAVPVGLADHFLAERDEVFIGKRGVASDKKINSIPMLENSTDKRMDIAIFDAALSCTADPDNINSLTIAELKRPQRGDADNDPVFQALKYVRDIKAGKTKKKNGRDFGNVSRVAFYCCVIGDLTPSLKESAESRGVSQTQDKEGYFGYNPTYGAYVEVISYDKLLKDAKQRNKALFDKLFEPEAKDLVHPELLGRENKN